MTDIATLGLKIDSSQASKASGALDLLAQIARNTANTVAALEKAAATAATTAMGLGKATEAAAKGTEAVGKSAAGATNLLDGFSKALDSAVGSVRDMSSVGLRGLQEMRAKFDPLFAAGQKYKQTLNDIRDAHRAGALTEAQMANAIMDTKVAFVAQTNTIRGVNGAFDANTHSVNAAVKGLGGLAGGGKLAQHELVNLSRQLQDVATMAAMGASPLSIISSQGAQFFDIFSSSKTATVGGAFKQIAGGIASVVTPMRLLVGSFAGLAVGGVFALKSIADSAKQFDDLARSVDASRGAIHSLQQAAAVKGIGKDDFAKGMQQFGAAVYDAKNNMGGLADVMRNNGRSAKDFNGYMEAAADLIKNATSDQQRLQLLQQMGLPATMEWVRFLSQGKEGIRAATAEAVKFNETAEGKLIDSARKFDEAWAKAWTNFGNNSKSAMLTALDMMGSLSSKVDGLAKSVGNSSFWEKFVPKGSKPEDFGLQSLTTNERRIGGAFSALSDQPANSALQKGLQDRANKLNGGGTIDPQVLKNQISLEQQRLGLLGQTTTAEEAALQVQKQADMAKTNGVKVDQSRIEILKQLAREQQNGVTAIKAQTDAENTNAATVGMSVGQAAEYTAVQNKLNEAKRNGQVLSTTDTASIRANAAALGDAARNADNMRFAYTSLVQGPMQTFTSAISQGASAMDALKKAGISALNALANKLTEMAAQNLWASAFGGGSGGFNLGSLFGGGGVGSYGQVSNATGLGAGTGGLSFPMFASGTNNAPGGWSVVGEKGPELINVPKGSQILPNGVGPGSGVTVNGGSMTINIQGNADEKTLAVLKQELAKRDAAFNANVVNTVRRAKQGRQLP